MIKLLLGMASFVFAFSVIISPAEAKGSPEPPGPGEQVLGPSIDAVLTAVPSDVNIVFTVVGSCKGQLPGSPNTSQQPVGLVFSILNVAATPQQTQQIFATYVASDIQDHRRLSAAPPGCYSAAGGEDLIVTSVKNFNNTGTILGADVSLSVIKKK